MLDCLKKNITLEYRLMMGLDAIGKRDEGRALCKEFVGNPSNAKSPQFDEVKQLELTI